jgi:hypothetical protein
MFIAAHANRWFSTKFEPVSLRALEGKAGMLERIDNKYVVTRALLDQASGELAKYFDILDIDGCRDFTYDTCYFDDANRRCYLDHHQARRQRVKVRMRKYIEAQLCFVEVKLKDTRDMTIKKRLRCSTNNFGALDETAAQFIQTSYHDLYKKPFQNEIKRNLDMRYKRITLVAKNGGERMTIDNGLQFFMGDENRAIDPALFVIESKSAKGNGIADRILRRLHQHPTKHVSKYCTGMAALSGDLKLNNFRRALRKLGLLECRHNNGNNLPTTLNIHH